MTASDKDKISRIAKAINRADSIAIYCHINPDGDTLGSALALYFALIGKGKSVDVLCDGVIPEKYLCLPMIEAVKLPSKGVHQLAIAVDCDNIDRLGGALKSFLSAKEQIAIDHHLTHAKFADISLVNADAAACAEVMFELLKHMKLLNNTSAELLFSAIIADTGCFQFPSTTRNTHEIACELMDFNFDSSKVIYNIHKRTPPEVFALKNRVLSKCKFYEDGKIAVITFTKQDFEETGTTSSSTEGIIVGAIDVSSVEVAFAVSEASNHSYKISVRTKKSVNASELAGAFGGGGHLRAAGCRLNGFYEDIVEKLIKAARDRL